MSDQLTRSIEELLGGIKTAGRIRPVPYTELCLALIADKDVEEWQRAIEQSPYKKHIHVFERTRRFESAYVIWDSLALVALT